MKDSDEYYGSAEIIQSYKDAQKSGDADSIKATGMALVEHYKEIRGLKKQQGKLPAYYHEANVVDALLDSMQLREVTKETPDAVLETLVECERVHKMTDIDALRENRLAPAAYATTKQTELDTHPAEPNSVYSKIFRSGDTDAPHAAKIASRSFYSKHAYGLFLPWENTPSCIVYTGHVPAQGSIAPGGENCALPGKLSQFRDQLGKAIERPAYVMFYSISNISQDLAGIRLGPVLLDKLAGHLQQHLRSDALTLSTLSPIRSFPEWVATTVYTEKDTRFTHDEVEKCQVLTGMTPVQWLKSVMPIEPFHRGKPVTSDEAAALQRDGKAVTYQVVGSPPEFESDVEQELFDTFRRDLCVDYLASARKNRRGMDKVVDDTADFHMSNGAYAGNIALQSGDAEWRDAGGVMVNYVYDVPLAQPQYQKAYEKDGVISIDSSLLTQWDERRCQMNRALPETAVQSVEPIQHGRLAVPRYASMVR